MSASPASSFPADFPYRLSVHDVTVSAAGAVMLGSGALLSHLHEKKFTVPAGEFDRNDLPPFDRPAAALWHPSFDNAGDIASGGLLLAAPVAAGVQHFTARRWTNLLTIAVMYGEATLISFAASTWSKALVARYRPYVYNSDIPPETWQEITETDDVRRSFFSRHTTLAFSSSVFLSTVLADINGTGWPTRAAQVSSLAVATGIGVSRVVAGEHFPSDVLAGAAVGAAIGYLIPRLHRGGSGTTVFCSGDGIYLSWRY